MVNKEFKNSPNLIGISGKIGSGKDLVGQIIQYLTTDWKKLSSEYVDLKKQSFDEYLKHCCNYSHISGWEIKKFADPLKEVICILIGCTREQLEDREFKEKELGEEWAKEQKLYTVHGLKLDSSPFPKKSPTPRMLLQQIGTDLFRNQLHPNCWINATFANYTKDDAWIITDCRFKNEANAIRDRGGVVVRINRDNIVIINIAYFNFL